MFTVLGTFPKYWRYRDLVSNLVTTNLKVRYQGAMLGFLWSLGNPLAMILLYDFVFTHVFRSDLPNYILHLVNGCCTTTCSRSLRYKVVRASPAHLDCYKKSTFREF